MEEDRCPVLCFAEEKKKMKKHYGWNHSWESVISFCSTSCRWVTSFIVVLFAAVQVLNIRSAFFHWLFLADTIIVNIKHVWYSRDLGDFDWKAKHPTSQEVHPSHRQPCSSSAWNTLYSSLFFIHRASMSPDNMFSYLLIWSFPVSRRPLGKRRDISHKLSDWALNSKHCFNVWWWAYLMLGAGTRTKNNHSLTLSAYVPC